MKMKSFLVEGGFLDLESICNAKLNYTKQLRHKAQIGLEHYFRALLRGIRSDYLLVVAGQ